ncbi:hypothetical protein, partial [Frankia sp. Cr1]|uniref:hypothetical protein n=1 Tax=Frankia sp. Cr1 TaxID=3073931 RepID=UPI002AD4B962
VCPGGDIRRPDDADTDAAVDANLAAPPEPGMDTPVGGWQSAHPVTATARSSPTMTNGHSTIYRVAVIVFADVPGIDARDAAIRLTAAVGDTLGDRLPTPHHGRPSTYPDTQILDVVDLSTAARNGYLSIQPVTGHGRRQGTSRGRPQGAAGRSVPPISASDDEDFAGGTGNVDGDGVELVDPGDAFGLGE